MASAMTKFIAGGLVGIGDFNLPHAITRIMIDVMEADIIRPKFLFKC